MPELPEVETIVRGLKPRLLGKSIQQVDAMFVPTLWLDDIRATGNREIGQIKLLIEGKKIEEVVRRGKMIIAHLSQGVTIIVHLKMTGQLIYIDSEQRRYTGGHPSTDMGREMPVKSTRVALHLDDGSMLYFNDQRKFGYIKIIPTESLPNFGAFVAYGPEPLTDQFSAEYLIQSARHRKTSIKQLLLDQSVVAGVGNIYADESLHMTQIHPAIRAGDLNPQRIENLVNNIKKVLLFSIEHNGTSSEHYVTASGEKGDMQNHLQVYRRHGMQCMRCGSEIERIVVGGRGTHFCPQCQKNSVSDDNWQI